MNGWTETSWCYSSLLMFPTLHRKLIQTHFCSSYVMSLDTGLSHHPTPAVTHHAAVYTHKSSHSKEAALITWSCVHPHHKTKCISTVYLGEHEHGSCGQRAFSCIKRKRLEVLYEKGGRGKVRAGLPRSIRLGPAFCLKGADKWMGKTDVVGQIQNSWHRLGICKTTKH